MSKTVYTNGATTLANTTCKSSHFRGSLGEGYGGGGIAVLGLGATVMWCLVGHYLSASPIL
eukprot:5279728-Amphidinium_carterae.1